MDGRIATLSTNGRELRGYTIDQFTDIDEADTSSRDAQAELAKALDPKKVFEGQACEAYEPKGAHQQVLARFGLTPGAHLRARSGALRDLLAALALAPDGDEKALLASGVTARSLNDVRFYAALALPGDLVVLLKDPSPPQLGDLNFVHFRYRSLLAGANY